MKHIFKLPRLKLRIGVLPTRVERDKTKYTRKVKHGGKKPVMKQGD